VTRLLWTLAACLLSVSGLLTLRDADPRELPPLPSAVASVAQDEPESPQYLSKPIREIQPIVDRVLAGDPDTDGQAPSDLGVIQASQWRLLSLRMADGDGEELRATIARPVWWIESSPLFERLGLDRSAWVETVRRFGRRPMKPSPPRNETAAPAPLSTVSAT
jgi:hypothetical protein